MEEVADPPPIEHIKDEIFDMVCSAVIWIICETPAVAKSGWSSE